MIKLFGNVVRSKAIPSMSKSKSNRFQKGTHSGFPFKEEYILCVLVFFIVLLSTESVNSDISKLTKNCQKKPSVTEIGRACYAPDCCRPIKFKNKLYDYFPTQVSKPTTKIDVY